MQHLGRITKRLCSNNSNQYFIIRCFYALFYSWSITLSHYTTVTVISMKCITYLITLCSLSSALYCSQGSTLLHCTHFCISIFCIKMVRIQPDDDSDTCSFASGLFISVTESKVWLKQRDYTSSGSFVLPGFFICKDAKK